MQFSKKDLKIGKRVCVRIKELREKQNISRFEMAKKLRLSETLLVALESCDFEKLPFDIVYQKKMIRSYLKVLDVKEDSYIQQFVFEELTPSQRKKKKAVKKKKNFNYILL